MEFEEVAAVQGGVISRAQALASGHSDHAIAWRLSRQAWSAPYPGVYVTYTGPRTRLTETWAALLAAGEGAVLTHASAGACWGIVEPPSRPTISIPAHRTAPRVPGVQIYRSRHLPSVTHLTKSPPRSRVEPTVIDLVDSARRLDDVLALPAVAVQKRLTTVERLRAEVEHRPRMRWRRATIDVLGDIAAGAHSALELRHLRDVERAHRLPAGRRQAPDAPSRGSIYRDVLYEEFGLFVELDGRLGHADAYSRLRDMRRDNAGVRASRVTLRYGYLDVFSCPCEIAGEMGDVLQRGGWRGVPQQCGRSCRLSPGQIPTLLSAG